MSLANVFLKTQLIGPEFQDVIPGAADDFPPPWCFIFSIVSSRDINSRDIWRLFALFAKTHGCEGGAEGAQGAAPPPFLAPHRLCDMSKTIMARRKSRKRELGKGRVRNYLQETE